MMVVVKCEETMYNVILEIRNIRRPYIKGERGYSKALRTIHTYVTYPIDKYGNFIGGIALLGYNILTK